MTIEIPQATLEHCTHEAAYTTPSVRTQGWRETERETRGSGDLLDMLGSWALTHVLRQAGHHVTLLSTFGGGDECDVRLENPVLRINVKTSRYDFKGDDPDRWNYHLHIKEEEAKKFSDAYVQAFVHLCAEPHVHLCGWAFPSSDRFKKEEITTFPKTNGQRGYRIHRKALFPMRHILWKLGEYI